MIKTKERSGMHRLALFVAMIGVLVAFAGCQQTPQLTEEQIRAIVQDELSMQLSSLDTLIVSNIYVTNEDGNIVALLSGQGEDESGVLRLYNDRGGAIAWLGSQQNHGMLGIYNAAGSYIVLLGGETDGDGFVHITNKGNSPVLSTIE
jgi:hypothetical protein